MAEVKEGYLFIGGVADGNWEHAPDDRPYYEVSALMKPPTFEDTQRGFAAADMMAVRHSTYKKMTFTAGGQDFEVFHEVSLKPEQVMALLFLNYRPPTQCKFCGSIPK